MNDIQSIFSQHYKNAENCTIIDSIREKSYDAFPDPYREEYYEEYTILFTEDDTPKCIRITKVISTDKVYVNIIGLGEAKNIFHNEEVDYLIDLHLFAKQESEDKDHIVLKKKEYLTY